MGHLSSFVLLVVLLSFCVTAKASVSDKIYKTLNSDVPCVRLTNATSQIGCSSSHGGSSGTIEVVNSAGDLDWVLTNGPHSPYVPVLKLSDFNGDTLTKLKDSARISGVLVIANETAKGNSTNGGFSPDRRCPNAGFGTAHGSTNCSFNVDGTSLAFNSFPFPIFALNQDSDVQAVIDCYTKHNRRVGGQAPKFPLCSAELKDFMYAAKDTYTCMRQGEVSSSLTGATVRCDALQGQNVWGSLIARNRSTPYTSRSIVMAVTRMDATGFFHTLSPGAETSTTGLVALLAVIDALGNIVKSSGMLQKSIVFAAFNGEAFDYIGSSRVVWEMSQRTFPPSPPSDENKPFPAAMNLSHISTIVEFSQIGLPQAGEFFIHFDRNSNSTDTVRAELKKQAPTGLKFTDGPGVLPSASVQSFLAEDRDIAGVVLADHNDKYINRYYNSLFDDAYNLEGVTNDDESLTTMQITNLATAAARTLYQLADPVPNSPAATELVVNSTYVHDLLKCFTMNFSCDLLKEVLSRDDANKLSKTTATNPRYVGPNQAANQQVAAAVSAILARSIGTNQSEITSQKACTNSSDSLNMYYWMQGTHANGSNSDNAGSCFIAPVYKHTALSPAFTLKDYRSTKYSTWAESRWNILSVRIYLAPGTQSQKVAFGVGWMVLIVSFLIVFQANRVSASLFNPSV